MTNSWYQRTPGDRETHCGRLLDGRVHALCGAQFRAIERSGGPAALPRLPADGGQVCVICYRETLREGSRSRPLPTDTPVHDQPPTGVRVCLPCVLIRVADYSPGPPAARIGWALSVDDWHSHAIDERAEHPTGMYRAGCGHLLQTVVTLHDEPLGLPCPVCSTLQLEVVRAALDRTAAALREAQSARIACARPSGRAAGPGLTSAAPSTWCPGSIPARGSRLRRQPDPRPAAG